VDRRQEGLDGWPSVLAFGVFSESLGPTQLAGGALVLAAVLVLQLPVRNVITQP
jgi:drug/metabolite transporter (DMT)-like permease